MYILGISCYFHDAAAALLCDGQLVAAALYACHMVLGHPRGFIMAHAAWEEAHSAGTIEQFLREVWTPMPCRFPQFRPPQPGAVTTAAMAFR